jgi:hypothetical protein
LPTVLAREIRYWTDQVPATVLNHQKILLISNQLNLVVSGTDPYQKVFARHEEIP